MPVSDSELRLLNALRVAVLAVDTGGSITFANNEAVETFVGPGGRLVGRTVFDLVSGVQDLDVAQEAIAQLVSGGVWTGDLPMLRADGTTMTVGITASPFLGRKGEITGAIGVLEDVTTSRLARTEAAREGERVRTLQAEAAERADLLQRVSADFARAVTVEEVGEALGIRLRESIGAKDAGVFVVDKPTGGLRLVASFGYEVVSAQMDRQVLAGAADCPALDDARVLVGAAIAERYPSLGKVNDLLGDRFGVAVPMGRASPAEGVVLFGYEHKPELGEAEVVLLGTLAAQCAIAVERTVLLRRTLEIAEELQSSLAASPLPNAPGIELAAHYAPGGDALEQVGGDWYDAVVADSGGMALVVGDVMGRGVQAATSMIRLRSGIRGLLTVDPAPDVVLSAADRLLTRDAPDQFVTAICALIDPVAGKLSLSNAGHVPALVIHPDGHVETIGSGAGLPLGVATQDPRKAAELPMERGTTLVLVTDGVVESRDHDLDAGIAQLAERAAALHDAPLASLVSGLAALAGADPHDDVTLVAARLT
jgi:PAS domain S-box-containing protein